MRKFFKLTFLSIIAGMVSHATQATDLNISGIVVASPCAVDSDSVSKEVDFGQLRGTDLKTAGAASVWQPFEIKLINCPITTTRSTVTFSGVPAAEDATLYANSGTAANVAVQMAQNADKTQVLGNASSMTVVIDSQHSATYELAGRLLTVAGNTGAGTFSSIVQMNFTYQ